MKLKTRKDFRTRRHLRVRRRVHGTRERPRLAVMVSNRNLYVQLIDDEAAVTLASASTIKDGGANNREAAKAIGRRCGELALGKGIRAIVVDRGGFRFHGCVKAVVDGAIEAGLSPAANPEEVGPKTDGNPAPTETSGPAETAPGSEEKEATCAQRRRPRKARWKSGWCS
jgi:large subunit ribosomal protein L18